MSRIRSVKLCRMGRSAVGLRMLDSPSTRASHRCLAPMPIDEWFEPRHLCRGMCGSRASSRLERTRSSRLETMWGRHVLPARFSRGRHVFPAQFSMLLFVHTVSRNATRSPDIDMLVLCSPHLHLSLANTWSEDKFNLGVDSDTTGSFSFRPVHVLRDEEPTRNEVHIVNVIDMSNCFKQRRCWRGSPRMGLELTQEEKSHPLPLCCLEKHVVRDRVAVTDWSNTEWVWIYVNRHAVHNWQTKSLT